MSATAIGPLRAADRDRWAELWTAYLRFYESELPERVYTSTWSRILDPNGALRALGMRDGDGRLAGITHYLFHATAWSTHDVCYLQDLYVDESVRGRGYGRALIEAVAGVARERPCHNLYWQTHVTNATARALYDRVARHAGFLVYTYGLVAGDGSGFTAE